MAQAGGRGAAGPGVRALSLPPGNCRRAPSGTRRLRLCSGAPSVMDSSGSSRRNEDVLSGRLGIQKAIRWCEKESPVEEQLAALEVALKAIKASQDRSSGFAERMQDQMAEEMFPASVAELCKKAADLEAARLPQDEEDQKIARFRFPRNRSERLLRQGAPMFDVVEEAAYQVLERWTDALRPFASNEEMPYVLAAMVHEDEKAIVRIAGRSPRMLPLPQPAPARDDPLGAALRGVTPQLADLARGRRWAWFDELSRSFDMMGEVDTSWPFTSERRLLATVSQASDDLAPCERLKGRQQQEMGHPTRRSPLSVGRVSRITSDFGWSLYNANQGSRTTGFGEYTPQVLGRESRIDLSPGPGRYEKPPTRSKERGRFPAVGRRRAKFGSLSLSQSARFLPGI